VSDMTQRATHPEVRSHPTSRRRTTPAMSDEPEVPGGRGRGALTPGQVIALQRTAGNRAVGSLLESAQPHPGPVVQRWAWVAASQVRPDAPGLDSSMKKLAGDKLVHDYASDAEFKDHAAGRTDHLGNLPGPASAGTWVRFGVTGSNLLGENHTQVTLEHVMQAVGSKSFIYEPFSVDVMPAGSAMKTAYEAENKDRFKKFGVEGVADKRQFGEESLFPKMGYGLNLLVERVTGPGDLDQLKPANYVGQPIQRYLKIGWAHAKDIADEVQKLRTAKKPVPAPLESLATAFAGARVELDAFITGLAVDGYLGDALDTPDGRKLLPTLLKFSRAFVESMLARVSTDAGLTKEERENLAKMPSTTRGDKGKVFALSRNLHFSHAVRDAVGRGVRYAGMGNEHLKYLTREGLPPKSRGYDMTAKDLVDFETLTQNLKSTAKSS
jgi:hypothetical protein